MVLIKYVMRGQNIQVLLLNNIWFLEKDIGKKINNNILFFKSRWLFLILQVKANKAGMPP